MLEIHRAIHREDLTSIEIRGKTYPIQEGNSGCRFVRVEIGADNNLTFIEQQQYNDDEYAEMARKGRQITWIVRRGHWGLIIDDKIVTV